MISCIEEKIRETVRDSPVPEDPVHAENTLAWVSRLASGAGKALRIAALGHDIERAVPERVRRGDFEDYDTFKQAHAARSAEILAEIMRACGAPPALISLVARLVERHETGGTPGSDILKEADSLSFFDTNIARFFEREGWDATKKRVLWGLRRLSTSSLHHIEAMNFGNRDLEILVQSCLNKIKKER